MTMLVSIPDADRGLAQRLERAEGHANALLVRARAEVDPASGAASRSIAGAQAMFDGPESPLTQTFGLGMERLPEDGELAALEAFFLERGAPVFHEVSSLAAPALADLLAGRGYVPVEESVVMCRPLADPARAPGGSRVRARPIEPDEGELWAAVAATGWGSESPEIGVFVRDLGELMVRCPAARCFIAEFEGWPVGAGSLLVHDGIALLAGASTVPWRRRLGAQAALLTARLHAAAAEGCDLAMIVAAPGSGSERNAVRRGFRPVYRRTKWMRAP